jgi:hypothetical protein
MSNPKTKRRYTMKISQSAKIWIDYHVTNSKKNYRPCLRVDYQQILRRFWRRTVNRVIIRKGFAIF